MGDKFKTALEILKQLSELTGAGSQQAKQDLLKENDTKELRMLLNTALNPFVTTHIKQLEVVETTTFSEYSFEKMIQFLQTKKALNTNDRLEVFNFVNSFTFDTDLRIILSKVIMKKLNVGIGAKMINKAFGENFLPATEMMKADDNIKIVEQWFEEDKEVWAEFKYDGIRGIGAFDDNMLKSIKTYNMRDFDLSLMKFVPLQLWQFYTILREATGAPTDLFLDFEVTGKKRQSVSGEVGRVLKSTAPEGIDENWIINIFDVESTDVTKDQGLDLSYNTRRAWLVAAQALLEAGGGDLPNIQIAQRWRVHNMEEVQQLFVKLIEEGQEGLILKCADGKYECKRSKNWIKMKSVNDCDLKIIDWYKGTPNTKREEFGGFTCESADGKLQVNVGGGYKDSVLKEILSNGPESYIGTIVAVKYNMVIEPEDSNIKSLFLPRFKELRIDKIEANKLRDIKEF